MKKSRTLVWVLTIGLMIVLGGLLFVLFLYRQQSVNFDQERAALQISIVNQKRDKDIISRLWENQAAENDTLVNSQTALLDKVRAYQNTVAKSIRFVNTVPQVTAEANEVQFKTDTSNLQKNIDLLNQATADNNSKKEEFKLKIETIYQQSGEDLKNRANPDGIK